MKKQQILFFVTLGLLVLLVSVASIAQVKAAPDPPKTGYKVIVTMSVTDVHGNPVQDMSNLPLSTTVYIWGSYAETPGNAPGNIEVTVSYSSTAAPYHWSAPVVLLPLTPETSPFGTAGNEVYLTDYQVQLPGYYLFVLVGNSTNNVNNSITDTVSVTAGPVLSEPATLGALALCFVAVGTVLVRKKRPSNQ